MLFYAARVGSEVRYIRSERNVLPSQILNELLMELDISDVSTAVLPSIALEKPVATQRDILEPAVQDIIDRSIAEFEMSNKISAFSPIFGANSYPIQDNLVFVLMPFQARLDTIYTSIVKPAIESELKMICRRADEITGNNPIMQDLWKSICEAKLIVADLTGFNPNVMYELGISHTLGKPSLLLYQEEGATAKFPFDLAHIRRVNYKDSAAGGAKLRADLVASIRSMLAFES